MAKIEAEGGKELALRKPAALRAKGKTKVRRKFSVSTRIRERASGNRVTRAVAFLLRA